MARRHGADLIVVGSHGKSLWREAVLGCFTCAVLYHTQYPTLLLNVRLKEGMAAGSCRLQATQLLRHVLFPTDFSEISARAGDWVTRLAPRGISQVTVLNALDVPGGDAYPPGFQEMAEAKARDSLAAWANAAERRRYSSGAPGLRSGPPFACHSPDFGIPGHLPDRHGHPGERFYQGDFPGQRGP